MKNYIYDNLVDKLILDLNNLSIKSNITSSRQKHGFIYEQEIIKKFNLVPTVQNSCFDAIYFNKDNSFMEKLYVQIKCIKNGSSIDMGSFIKNQNITKDFLLIIGFWDKEKTIVNEHILYIDTKLYIKDTVFEFTTEMHNEMKSISNHKKDDLLWSEFIKKYKKLYPKDNLIKLRFKRDHKTQKRIQCAINFKTFNTLFMQKYKKFKL